MCVYVLATGFGLQQTGTMTVCCDPLSSLDPAGWPGCMASTLGMTCACCCCVLLHTAQVNEFVKRVRAFKIHLLIIGHIKKALPMFGQAKAAKKMLAQLPEVFRQVGGWVGREAAAGERTHGHSNLSLN